MKKFRALLIVLWPVLLFGQGNESRKSFFLHLAKLEFDSAKLNALAEKDSNMKFEMNQLAEILYYEGQIDKSHFKVSNVIKESADEQSGELTVIRLLNAGYLSLFYDRSKGEAYKNFYKGYQLSKKLENSALIKTVLLALFKYYNFEIAQNSDFYKPYLDHFEKLKDSYIDDVWLAVYKMIFYSKTLEKLDGQYFQMASSLNEFEEGLNPKNHVLVYVFFEKAIHFEIAGDLENSAKYYKRVISQSNGYPFLKGRKFFSCIKLLALETKRKRLDAARNYLSMAKKEIDLSDTLRSNYYLNLLGSDFYRALNKNDSAFILLKRAYIQDFHLDFRRNTLEINRLSVELETQEKENTNLQLRQNRNWLISALAGVGLLFLTSYFAYTNQRSKNKIQAKEKEVQAMKLEKVLKDQEIFGIDAMLEGQEKERHRIAGDLHDNLGSLLAAVKLHFHSLKSKKDFAESERDQLLNNTNDLLEEAYQKVRSMAHAGNAGVHAQEGLLPAVKNFASKVSVLNKLVIEVEEHGMNSRIDNTLEITIFRIIQELVTNIIKHAQASEVTIHLTHHEESINLMIEDNGVGFDLSRIKPSGGMGLHSIQKKIENLGGHVTIDSILQKGTTVIIDVPIS